MHMSKRDDDSKPRDTDQAETTGEHCAALGTPPAIHAAAAALHGWAQHIHHTGEPMRMTRATYEAAIKAVDARPCRPHREALSPHHALTL